MSDDFLSRWSRRKHAVRKGEKAADAAPVVSESPVANPLPNEVAPPEPLPPVESLTTESDFSPFMKADVDPGLRREALKVLLRDPRFNVMDGLDVYIDDYSKPDPLPPEWLAKLNQTKHFGHYVEEALEGAEAHGAEDPQEGREGPREGPAELQKAIPEQPVEAPAPDTAALQNPGAEVGESEAGRN